MSFQPSSCIHHLTPHPHPQEGPSTRTTHPRTGCVCHALVGPTHPRVGRHLHPIACSAVPGNTARRGPHSAGTASPGPTLPPPVQRVYPRALSAPQGRTAVLWVHPPALYAPPVRLARTPMLPAHPPSARAWSAPRGSTGWRVTTPPTARGALLGRTPTSLGPPSSVLTATGGPSTAWRVPPHTWTACHAPGGLMVPLQHRPRA